MNCHKVCACFFFKSPPVVLNSGEKVKVAGYYQTFFVSADSRETLIEMLAQADSDSHFNVSDSIIEEILWEMLPAERPTKIGFAGCQNDFIFRSGRCLFPVEEKFEGGL